MGDDDRGRRKEIIASPMISVRLGVYDVANRHRCELLNGILDRTGSNWRLSGIDKDDTLLG